jgi:two-component system sensor histidine kinase BaeS
MRNKCANKTQAKPKLWCAPQFNDTLISQPLDTIVMRIQNKLFFSWLLSSAVLIAIMAIVMRWSVDRGMLEYVNTREASSLSPAIAAIAAIYEQGGNLSRFRNNARDLNRFVENNRRELSTARPPRREPAARNGGRNQLRDRPRKPPPPPPRPRGPPNEYSLFDQQRLLIAGNPEFGNQILLPVDSDGKIVAWLGMRKRREITDNYELNFLENTQDILLVTSVILILISISFTLPLARHLVSPIRKIADTIHTLNLGQYDASLSTKRSDEFAQLAGDINELSDTLKENDSLRKRWLADTSHELRTPLAILQGEIEAMVDGIRPMNEARLQSIHQEILHLSRLVADLQELGSADIGGLSYRKEKTNLSDLLSQQILHHESVALQKNISMALFCPPDIFLKADPQRFNQLMDNLINNACKYTDENGNIDIRLIVDEDSINLSIEDSNPGVPDDALDKLFDHLYRVENSRNRNTGGSGLGLAISKRIVEAHQGTIVASHSSLGGVKITLNFPVPS